MLFRDNENKRKILAKTLKIKKTKTDIKIYYS